MSNEEDLWAAAAEDLEEQRKMLRSEAQKPKEESAAAAPAATVMAEARPAPAGSVDDKKLEMILDIPLSLSVEMGRSKMLINDLLQLGQGSVIELTKLVGEPLDVFVNEKLIARGEVVVVNNEKFGIRLTEVISPADRIQSMGS